ncbi:MULTISPECIES: hypothetical protein [Sulfurimonas]|uniref:hypothetical protein n=1 Tax=Sulfurimonas TaxID=202746 RepID=UPI00165EF904|nr:hypothetical protein [Sulfurimonas indica]
MRSRDGDYSFTRSISSIIFLLLYSSAIFADEYIISYRYSVKNATLYNETLYISKAMKKCTGKPYDTLILDPQKSENLKEILLANQDEFIEFLYKIGLSVKHREETLNGVNDSSTILTLPSKCFKVDFNDNSVKIAPLK